MRFTYGCPPTLLNFDPQNQGWRQLREPSPRVLSLVGSIVGVPICAVVVWAWVLLDLDLSLHFHPGFLGDSARWAGPLLLFLALPVIFIGIIAAHELIHALGCPRFGLTSMTVIGVWPSRLLFYAGHLEAMPAWHYVLYASAPFLVLSLLPMLVAYWVESTAMLCAVVSVVNALFCGGDLMIIACVVTQMPLRALVQNEGWSTWWKVGG